MRLSDVIIKPSLTEKATKLAINKVYSFEVDLRATKYQVRQVLEKLYKVKVSKVRMLHRMGKVRRSGRKMVEKKSAETKIAYVFVKTGKIDLFPQA